MTLPSELISRLQALKALLDLGDVELASSAAARLQAHREIGSIAQIIECFGTHRYTEAGGLINAVLAEADAAHALVPAGITNSLGMQMLWCPPGDFLMGSPEDEREAWDEDNQVQVRISRGFWMARTPATQDQWQALMGSNPSRFKDSKELPVEQVSWDDAVKFCDKLNAQESLPNDYHYALPTCAQWEYACRAGTTTPFAFGSTLTSAQANFDGNHPYGTTEKGPYLRKTCAVGSYPPNAWGFQDMHGNVWEWCADWYGAALLGGTDPTGPATGTRRVFRGGAWLNGADYCRAAHRSGNEPGFRSFPLSVRPALAPSR